MSLIAEIVTSISNVKGYGGLQQKGLRQGLLYLFLLSLLLAPPAFFRQWINTETIWGNLRNWMANQSPDFTLAEGKMSLSPDSMAIFNGEDEFILILGPRGKVVDSLALEYPRMVLVYPEKMVVQSSNDTKREMLFKDYRELRITRSEMVEALNNKKMFRMFLAVFWLIFYFIGKLISALFVASFGLNFRTILRNKMTFREIYILSIRALTLGMIMDAILNLTGLYFPYYVIIYYLMAGSYLWQTMRNIHNSDRTAAGL